jgi:hypothetical protein
MLLRSQLHGYERQPLQYKVALEKLLSMQYCEIIASLIHDLYDD